MKLSANVYKTWSDLHPNLISNEYYTNLCPLVLNVHVSDSKQFRVNTSPKTNWNLEVSKQRMKQDIMKGWKGFCVHEPHEGGNEFTTSTAKNRMSDKKTFWLNKRLMGRDCKL